MPPKRRIGGCGAGASTGAGWIGEEDAVGNTRFDLDSDMDNTFASALETTLACAKRPSSGYSGFSGPGRGNSATGTKRGKNVGLTKDTKLLNGSGTSQTTSYHFMLGPAKMASVPAVSSARQKNSTDLSAIQKKGTNSMLGAAMGQQAPVLMKRQTSEPVERPIDTKKFSKPHGYDKLPMTQTQQRSAPSGVKYPAAHRVSRKPISPELQYGLAEGVQAGSLNNPRVARQKRTAQSHTPANQSSSHGSVLVKTTVASSSSSSNSGNWRKSNNNGGSLSNSDTFNKHKRAAMQAVAKRTERVAAAERKKSTAGTSSEHALTLDSSSDEESGPPDPKKPFSTAAAFCFIGSHSLGACTIQWPAAAPKKGEGSSSSSGDGRADLGGGEASKAGTIEIHLESQGTVSIEASEMVSWFVDRPKSHRVPLPITLRTAAGQPLHQRFKEGDGVYDPTSDDQVLLLLKADDSDNSSSSASTWTIESEVRHRLASYWRETTSADFQDSSGDVVVGDDDDDGEEAANFDPKTLAVDRLEAADQGTVANALHAPVPSPHRRSRRSSTRAASAASSSSRRLDNTVVVQYPKDKDASDPVRVIF